MSAGACLLLSKSEHSPMGEFLEPSREVDFAASADSLMGHAIAFSRSETALAPSRDEYEINLRWTCRSGATLGSVAEKGEMTL